MPRRACQIFLPISYPLLKHTTQGQLTNERARPNDSNWPDDRWRLAHVIRLEGRCGCRGLSCWILVGCAEGCLAPGYTYCSVHFSCPRGTTCGPNHTCLGDSKIFTGPVCGEKRCPADHLCGTADGIQGCYDPRVAYLRGGALCYKARSYPAGDRCARTDQIRQATTPKRQPESIKDAATDTPKKKEAAPHYGFRRAQSHGSQA
jgi:hypothetical protein